MAKIRSRLFLPFFLVIVSLFADVLSNVIFEKNIAYKKTATQSSVTNGGVAGRAIDGNTTTNWIGGSCTMTKADDPAPWWMVDLGANYNVTHVIISNRGDCCGDKLHDFSIKLFDVDPSTKAGVNGKLCANQIGKVQNGFTIMYDCAARSTGRYLRIKKNIVIPPRDPLTLCEVHVVGYPFTPTCPEGFLTHGDVCYFHSTNASTWRDANKDCESMDAKLAIPQSKEADDMMTSKLKENGTAGDVYWLGAHQQSTTEGWRTVDSEQETLDYMNWEHEEENCVVKSETAQYKWEIKPCSNVYQYICFFKM